MVNRGPWAQRAQVPDRVGPLRVGTPGRVELAHERGQRGHVWTVADPAEMHRRLDLGVDGLMPDRPEARRQVFLDRGLWI